MESYVQYLVKNTYDSASTDNSFDNNLPAIHEKGLSKKIL